MISRNPRKRSVFASRLVNTASDGAAPRVLDDLRAAIVSGDEPPGTLIPIDAVASFFQVSQIPVREALKLLIGEGLVEHIPHVGYSVAKLSFEEFLELYQVRQALEEAALRIAVVKATEADDEAARNAHDALRIAVLAEDERGYHEGSRAFHISLIAAANMPRLQHQYEATWNLTEPARPMARVPSSGRHGFFDEHRSMLDAFIARDGEALVAESKRHFSHLLDEITALRNDPDVFKPA